MGDKSIAAIIDNGAYSAKVGLSNFEEPKIIPNCIMKAKAERRRAFIGNQVEECRDASSLFYLLCFQKGYLLNWDTQKSVWDYIFSPEGAEFTLYDRNLVITEPPLNFPGVQDAMMEILFEEYQCAGILKTTTAELAAYNYSTECDDNVMQTLNCIVIDLGYSFTHIVPFVRGRVIFNGIRRVDIGGKVLTNHLKELVSYRHLNVMDESYVVNHMKEDVCFVAQNFKEELLLNKDPLNRRNIAVEYVLPDFTTVRRGYIRSKNEANSSSDQQTIRLSNERFTVPELLFNPSDVGIMQIGIPGAVIDALKDCPPHSHSEILRNIIVIGGSSLFRGFLPRLKSEIRALAPNDLEVSLIFPEDPITYGWYGGRELIGSESFKKSLWTRKNYEEYGYTAVGIIK